MNEELKEIINNLKDVRTETQSKVSDEIIWDTGIRVYISQYIQNSQNNSKKSNRPTEKQIKLMNNLNIPIKGEMTKQEATKLIDEKIGKK